MRQIFTSPRLENVEAVAQLLRDADIEVRISNDRSYRGNRRGNFSYRDNDAVKPAVWVIRSEDQHRAREILRENGLIDSSRPNEGFAAPTFRFEPRTQTKTPATKRAFRIKIGLLVVIGVVLTLALIRNFSGTAQQAAQVASAPKAQATKSAPPPVTILTTEEGAPVDTPDTVAAAVLAAELPAKDARVQCLRVDGVDPSEALLAQLRKPDRTLAPASECVEAMSGTERSRHEASGRDAMFVEVRAFRPQGDRTGTVRVFSYRVRGQTLASKSVEVRRAKDAWQVVP